MLKFYLKLRFKPFELPSCYCLVTLALAAVFMLSYHVEAEITAATLPAISGNVQYDNKPRCMRRRYADVVNKIDDFEDLKLDVPVHIAFDNRQRKRFLLYLNSSTPLTIYFSQNVSRKIVYNSTTTVSRLLKATHQDQRLLVLPCALRGQYDIFVVARQRGSIKIEAHGNHPQAHSSLLNHTNPVRIRTRNRIGKGQMIVQWRKSKFDFHAIHYCLVLSSRKPHKDFCEAVYEYAITSAKLRRRRAACSSKSILDIIWLGPAERMRKIDPHATSNIICSGSRTRQHLSGLIPQQAYYLDLFGVHTGWQNLTFHIGSTLVAFNRTHPLSLRPNVLSVEKIKGLHGVQVFSFKIPSSPTTRSLDMPPVNSLDLRYLILPCAGSEVNVKILRKRERIGIVSNIYQPMYIRVPQVQVGERYMVRFSPSNVDEKLRANHVGLAVTTRGIFSFLPELPLNITVLEVRTTCRTSTIAWHSSPDERGVNYCIIVLNLPQRNRSAVDYTNYCLDFDQRIVNHTQFHLIQCLENSNSVSNMEVHTIENLNPGENYLIYVTANLKDGKPLPYQSLRVHTNQRCYMDSQEQAVYY